MTGVSLPANFVLQSSPRPIHVVVQRFRQDRGAAAMIVADRYPQCGLLRIDGLLPERHYRLSGCAGRFCRTDADGAALIEVGIDGPTLLLIDPVV